MSAEFSQQSALQPDTLNMVNPDNSLQLLQQVSSMVADIHDEDDFPIKEVEQPVDAFTEVKQPVDAFTAAAIILKRGESVAPGEIVTRSRFGEGMPYSPVNLISSELASLSVTDNRVHAVFIEHQLAEPDDISQVIFDKTVEAQQRKGQVDRNLRYNMPGQSLSKIHQGRYSRKNNQPTWSNRSERVAATEFVWSEQDTQIVKRPLADKALDTAINNHLLLKKNPKRQEDLVAKRAKYLPSTPAVDSAVA